MNFARGERARAQECAEGAADGVTACIACDVRGICVGHAKVGVVEEIEGFGAELQSRRFIPERELLVKT